MILFTWIAAKGPPSGTGIFRSAIVAGLPADGGPSIQWNLLSMISYWSLSIIVIDL